MIGESDGYGKYDADDPAATKARLITEKVREDRLREAGVARTGPPQQAMLATLAKNPRSSAYARGR